MKKIIIVTGLPGAGKTAVSSYIKELGIPTFQSGDITREEMKKRGFEMNTFNSEKTARKMRLEFGMEYAVKLTWERYAGHLKDNIICIDGPRDLFELSFLKGKGKVFLLVVKTLSKIRYDRIVQAGGYKVPKDYKEFLWRSKKEAERGMNELIGTQEVKKFVIKNDGTFENVMRRVDEILEEIKKE